MSTLILLLVSLKISFQNLTIADNDRNLLASGITTFYCSITDSYEPGLRSRDSARALIDFILGTGKQVLNCNHRIHIRHEEANIAGHQELCDWMVSGRVHILSINDHLPPLENQKRLSRYLILLRSGCAYTLRCHTTKVGGIERMMTRCFIHFYASLSSTTTCRVDYRGEYDFLKKKI